MSMRDCGFDGVLDDAVPRRVRRDFERLRLQCVIDDESRTVQSEKDLTDINNIVARFDREGVLPPGKGPGQYMDVTALNADLMDVIERSEEIIDQATAYFSELESKEAEEAAKLAEANKQLLERAKVLMEKQVAETPST